MHGKKTSRRKREGELFLRQTIRRALVVLRSVIPDLRSVTLEWIELVCVHKLYPLNRIVRNSRSSSCDRNRFDSLPVYRTSYAVRSAITATAELLVLHLKLVSIDASNSLDEDCRDGSMNSGGRNSAVQRRWFFSVVSF